MIVGAFLMAALLQPRFMDWPEPGKDGTALIESVGCRSVRILEDGHVALTEGAIGRAQLLFARGIAEGECRMFEGGEKVIREIGWFYMNARWTDALAPGQSWEAIRIHPESDAPYAAPDVIDAYWVVADFFHFPNDFFADGRVPEVSAATPEAKAQEPRQTEQEPQPQEHDQPGNRVAAADTEDVERAEEPFDIRDLTAQMEVVEVDQQRFERPTKSGYMEHSWPSWTLFKMRVDNFRGPGGNMCVDILWFNESGLLDGEVACASAPSSGQDVREFTTVVAPGIPDDADLHLAFRSRYSTDFGDRIPFRGAEERRAPAIYTVTGDPIVCDDRADLEYLALAPDTPDNRALAFTMVQEGRCAAWEAGTMVDVLGVRGDYALARAQGDGLNIMWILWLSLE